MLRYTVAVASLTYLKAVHPGLARGVHQHRASDSEAGPFTPAKAARSNQPQIWCWLIWIVLAFTILSFMCGSLRSVRAVPADMLFGTMVIVLVLVCISLAILFTIPSSNTRQRSIDHGTQSPIMEQPNMSTHHQISNTASPTTNTNQGNENVGNRHPIQSPISSLHSLSTALPCQRPIESPRNEYSSDELQAMRRVEEPPPYHVAYNLPMPDVHSILFREPEEIPPPPYDSVLRGNIV